MVQRRKVILGLGLGTVGAATGLAAAGCSSAAHAKGNSAEAAGHPAAGSWQTPSAAAVNLTVSPATGQADVSPADPITVAVAGGKLKSVTVAAG